LNILLRLAIFTKSSFVKEIAVPKVKKNDLVLRKRPRFWLGPFLAACFFSIGYGLTERILLSNNYDSEPKVETFTLKRFPGKSIKTFVDANNINPIKKSLSNDIPDSEKQFQNSLDFKSSDIKSPSTTGLPRQIETNMKLKSPKLLNPDDLIENPSPFDYSRPSLTDEPGISNLTDEIATPIIKPFFDSADSENIILPPPFSSQ